MCTVEKHGRVFLLTLTGAGEHRLNHDLIAAIRSAFARIRSESLAGGCALVTAAEGRFFSNGFDLDWANAAGSPAAARSRLHTMVEAFIPVVADLLTLPLPTVAAITGHAAAGGFMLAMCHDYAVMRGDRGFLYMSEMDLGLPFPGYFTAMMRDKFRDSKVIRDVAMGAKKIGGKEALQRGIVDRVFGGPEETMEAAMKLGEQLAGRGWHGSVYKETRMAVFPEFSKAVGLAAPPEKEEEKVGNSKL